MTTRAAPIRRYQAPPPKITGLPLDARIGVVIPETVDITNIHPNPSIETNTTGYTAVSSASLARVITEQRRGAYSLQVTPNAATGSGVYYGTITTVAGALFNWAFDFLGVGGLPYKAYWGTTAGVQLSRAVPFKATGYWQRISVPWRETSSTTRRLYVVKDNSASVRPFYIDGNLIPYPISDLAEWRYFDGDSRGLTPLVVDFYWTGTPHGSTSIMKANTRAGGRIIALAEYGFLFLGLFGLGLPAPVNVRIPLTLPGGKQFQRTLAGDQVFSLLGYLDGDGSFPELMRRHSGLTAALNVLRQPHTQPMILTAELIDACGDAIGERAEIICSLDGGLDGQIDNHYQMDLDLRFQAYLPYVANLDGTEGAALNVRTALADADYIVRRDANGIWSDLQTGLNSTVLAALWMPDGRLLIGGDFTDAGGVADADFLAYYNPATDTFSAVNATPLNASVRTLLLLPSGNVLVGGRFQNAGGAANADLLCLLTVATGVYSALNATPLSGGVSPEVNALALLPNNTVALGGEFLNAGGAASADYFAKLTLSTGAYSAFVTTALTDIVHALAVDQSGRLWVGGGFNNVDGIANQDGLTVLRGPLYDDYKEIIPFPSSLDQVEVIQVLSNGNLLIGGTFVSVNGDTDWNRLLIGVPAPGGGSSTMGLLRQKIFGGINNPVMAASESIPGTVLVGGEFSSVADIALFDGLFQYSGNTLVPLDLDLPSLVGVYGLAGKPNGEMVVGFDGTGIGYTSGTTTITNSGSADAYPVIVISYSSAATVPAPFFSIRNLTTGQIVSFSDLSFLPGETITIDLRDGIKTVTSSIRGDLAPYVLFGSQFVTFKLSPGPNKLNILIDIAAAANASAYAWWVPGIANIADTVR